MVSEQLPPPAVATPDEALRLLLGSGSSYDSFDASLAATRALASFGSLELALPQGVKSAPQLTCLLSEPDSLLFKGFRELLLLSLDAHAERIAEEGLPGLYVDPVLQRTGSSTSTSF